MGRSQKKSWMKTKVNTEDDESRRATKWRRNIINDDPCSFKLRLTEKNK